MRGWYAHPLWGGHESEPRPWPRKRGHATRPPSREAGLRNVFDQYEQPENRLTHALVCTLASEHRLIRPFLSWLGASNVPPLRELHLVEQQVPGEAVAEEEGEAQGLPDACFFTSDGWATLIESKVQAKGAAAQLRRHIKTAERHGYAEPHLVLITVDQPKGTLPPGIRVVEWCDLYAWFRRREANSSWARRFTEYLEVFESKMVGQDYDIRGTLTMFDGLKFDDEHPYTWREGKRLIRLLGDELQKRRDLTEVGMDPKGERRPAITGRGREVVWDFLPLRAARKARYFTHVPHMTMSIGRDKAVAAVTVPNGVKGGFRTKLKNEGLDGFRQLVREIEENLRPVMQRSEGSSPMIVAQQRHYPSQSSSGVVDARLEADLRTLVPGNGSKVKHQAQWIEAVYDVLCHKRSNIQLTVESRFSYDCPLIRSPKAVDLFADAWKAMWPLVKFVLQG